MTSTNDNRAQHTKGPWYVGAQNDALYIITRPPRPSNDDIVDIPDVEVIASVNACNDEANAKFIVDACNAHEMLVSEVQKNGPLALDLMVARAEIAQLRADLWSIAGSVVAACDSGDTNIAQMACMEGSPLVGESRAVIAAHGLSNADVREATDHV